MTLPIYIPSRSRANVTKNTLSKLPKNRYKDISIVVPESQAEQYRHSGCWNGVEIIASPVNGIARNRHWIGNYAKQSNQPHFVMMDDDLVVFSTRIDNTSIKLRQSTHEDINAMLVWMEVALQKYAAVSISARGNNMVKLGSNLLIGDPPLTMENVRLLRVLAYQTDPFLSVEHDRVMVMEDFDVNLQLLEKGYKNIQTYWWTQDQRQTASPGGCADYRTHQTHETSAKRLQELHPQFVKLTKKKNKTVTTHNNDFQERTEVRISWKKAYASSQKVIL